MGIEQTADEPGRRNRRREVGSATDAGGDERRPVRGDSVPCNGTVMRDHRGATTGCGCGAHNASFLRATFVHCRGVGAATERRIWAAGARDWDDFLRVGSRASGLGPAKREAVTRDVALSDERLSRRDARHFGERLPSSEAWRLAPDFLDRLAYLDIETTGQGPGSALTVVGVYALGKARLFVRGANLDDFPGFIEPFDVLVTYGGKCFDVPFLVGELGERMRPSAVVDLRYVLGAVGLKGGLKAVERAMGVERPADVRGLDGYDAVRLWYEYETGKKDSLLTLCRYNLEDVMNLETLLALACGRCVEASGMPVGPASLSHTPEERLSAAAEALAFVESL